MTPETISIEATLTESVMSSSSRLIVCISESTNDLLEAHADFCKSLEKLPGFIGAFYANTFGNIRFKIKEAAGRLTLEQMRNAGNAKKKIFFWLRDDLNLDTILQVYNELCPEEKNSFFEYWVHNFGHTGHAFLGSMDDPETDTLEKFTQYRLQEKRERLGSEGGKLIWEWKTVAKEQIVFVDPPTT